jgi:hypothetical protein
MKPTLSDLPPRYQAQALAQLAAVPHPRTVQLQHVPTPPPPAKKAPSRIRQNSAGLNKTEQAFYDYLKTREDPGVPRTVLPPQSVTLRIANGCRYTPDFVVAYHHSTDIPSVDLVAYEVKGFMRDDAAVKIKVAATAFPWITFHLVAKLPGGGGGWSISEVQS